MGSLCLVVWMRGWRPGLGTRKYMVCLGYYSRGRCVRAHPGGLRPSYAAIWIPARGLVRPGTLFQYIIVQLSKFLVLLRPTGLLIPAATHSLVDRCWTKLLGMAARRMMAVILFSLLVLLVPQAIARKQTHPKCEILPPYSYNAGRRNKIEMDFSVLLF